MHIVYLNKVILDSSLPAVNFSLGNVIGLAEAGAHCTFLAQKRSASWWPEQLWRDFDLAKPESLHLGVRRKSRAPGLNTNQWFYWWALRQMKEWRSRGKLDAVISRDPGALPWLAYMKRWGVKVYYQPHNYYIDLSVRDDEHSRVARKYSSLERRWLDRMDGVLCLQEPQAALFRQHFERVHVCRPGLLRTYPRLASPGDTVTLGYVGSMQMKKGVEVLLDALLLLPPHFRLLLMGGRHSGELDPLAKAIHERGLSDRVEATGHLPWREVSARLQTIDMGVIPLRDTFYNRYLTAPNKLFDMLAHGLPVVASDLPSVRDLMTDGREGLFVHPENPEAIARAAQRIANEPAAFAENARKAGEDALWRRRAQVFLDVIAGDMKNA